MKSVFLSSAIWDWVWQSTLFLGLGGLLSLIWSRSRPARAHRILFLAMVACLVTPFMSETVRHLGWGMLASEAPKLAHFKEVPPPVNTLDAPVSTRPTVSSPSSAGHSLAARSSADATKYAPALRFWDAWPSVFVVGWLLVSMVCLLRLLFSLIQELILLHHAKPLRRGVILEVLNRARVELELVGNPVVYSSDQVRSPMICCWGLRPTLIVPQSALERVEKKVWFGLLCHELAHLKRRDHIASLMGQLVVCLLPWQPLAWWVRGRLDRLSELACDDWVVACGHAPEVFAESLLGFLPARQPAFALAVVGLGSRLEDRIKNILAERHPDPRMGRSWASAAFAIMLSFVAVAAIAQKPATSTPSVTNANMPKTVVPQEQASLAAGKAHEAESSNVLVDPKSGVQFRKTATLVGSADVIEYATELQISPNGQFLLWGRKVVPVDGGKPFYLVDNPKAGRSCWSPDGKWVAYYAGAIWIMPVNPVTAHSTGPARQLVEGNYWYQGRVGWSPDSESIIFMRSNKENQDEPWMASIKTGVLTQIVDSSGLGRRSPDEKHLAFWDQGALWIKPIPNGEAKKVVDGEYRQFLQSYNVSALSWPSDGKWLFFRTPSQLQFFRLVDNYEAKIDPPASIGDYIGASADRKKLYFYHPSYDWREPLKVVSLSGGPIRELGRQQTLVPSDQFWSPDSQKIMVVGKGESDDSNLLSLPLSGEGLIPWKINLSIPGKISDRQLSPDCQHLLVSVEREDKAYDLWVAPVSWQEKRTIGPAVAVFRKWNSTSAGGAMAPGLWSPDSKMIAVMERREGQIWLATMSGGEPVQLTHGPGYKGWPIWSPDAKLIAYHIYFSATNQVLQVMSTAGEAKTTIPILASAGDYSRGRWGSVTWSPDGQALTVSHDGMISFISIAGVNLRTLVNLKDLGKDDASWLRWSPNGKQLAFIGETNGEGKQLLLFHSEDGRVEKLADGIGDWFFWSPDGKWISFESEQTVKTRREGVLWSLDVEEAAAKLTGVTPKDLGGSRPSTGVF